MDDAESTNEIMNRLTALSMEETPARSRLERISTDSRQLRMPQPRPSSFHESVYGAEQQNRASRPISYHDASYTPEKRPRSPFSQPYSTPTLSSASSNTSPRTFHSPTGQITHAPLMVRAHSSPMCLSPSVDLPSQRSASPLRSPKRVRSPFRHGIADDGYTASTVALSPEIGSISEDAELEIAPRTHQIISSSHVTSALPSMTFPRPLRRRPASPLRSLNNSRASSVPASPYLSAIQPVTSSSSIESFPSDTPYYYQTGSRSISLSSSMPSTPTSIRSRSPSISSLETIPDSPDAETQAIEEDSLEREERKRLWEQLYGTTPNLSTGTASASTGARTGFGSRDKRKRWSVCGAEKRSDLNLETIWED